MDINAFDILYTTHACRKLLTDIYVLQPWRNMGPCQDSRWHRKPADYPTKSMLCAPVLLEGKVVAVIQLLNKRLGLKRGCDFFGWGVGGWGIQPPMVAVEDIAIWNS